MEPNFFRPLKRRSNYITREDGTFHNYPVYRHEIAEDCQFRCVYCDCHQDTVGGEHSMELDHFRPWRKKFKPTEEKKFEHLKNEPTNLVHSCGVCNGFKWSHWPTENPDQSYDNEKGWIDPFKELRADFFEVTKNGTMAAKKAPAQYQITKLRLNRPLLKRQREFYILTCSFAGIEKKWQQVIEQEEDSNHAKTAAEALHLLNAIKQFLDIP